MSTDPKILHKQMTAQLHSSPDIYKCLNALRDWTNENFPDFELYLEDVWNENVAGETHFEYILRSKNTYNETAVIGYDVYLNRQDEKGVWHLGAYQNSVILMPDPQPLVDFILDNQK